MTSKTIKKFTDNLIKGLRPEGKEYNVSCNGLVLRVFPSGVKSWVFTYRSIDGKPGKRLSIGKYPAIGIHEANLAVQEARRVLEKGIDPVAYKKAELAKRSDELTVSGLWSQFKTWHFKNLRERSKKDYEIEMERFVIPKWGNLPVSAVTRQDAINLMKSMVEEGCNTAANHVRSHLSKIWNFGLDHGFIESTPFSNLPKLGVSGEGGRSLSNEEIAKFWYGLDKLREWERNPRASLRLILLLGRRPGEMTNSMRAQFNLDKRTWHLNPEKIRQTKLKKTKPIVIPLPPLAVEILEEQIEGSPQSEFVFPGRGDPTQPYTVNALDQLVRKNHRSKMGINTSFTPHDLRHTCSTGLAGLGFSQEIIDRVLCHKIGGISGVYNHHDYVEQRKKALHAWADHISKILQEFKPKVVPAKST